MNETVQRIMRAVLTMQRASWEQGMAAQAFLEAGETETALLMAPEAVNQQTADGCCAQMGADIAATDACAIGEALICACETTGDERLSAAGAYGKAVPADFAGAPVPPQILESVMICHGQFSHKTEPVSGADLRE